MCCSADGQSDASKGIDKALRDEEVFMKQNSFNLLLLGTGESGKSTIAKQMKILHLNGFTEEECRAFREVVYGNIVSCIKTIATAAQKFGYKCKDENLADSIRNLTSSTLTPELWDGIIRLWKDDAITKAWARSSEYQLIDSARYWFENAERISKAGDTYIPSVDDILHARQMTTGIVEITWVYDKKHYKMIDVGGQRNHRAKWIHAFDRVTAVIFCVALSEYDQMLREDESKNRMHESMELFDQLINSEWFFKTPIVVFFNKKDIFQEKIKQKSLKVCFPDYNGPDNYEEAVAFIKDRFEGLDQRRAHTRKIYTHETCATDTDNVKRVFEVVRDTLLRNLLGAVFG